MIIAGQDAPVWVYWSRFLPSFYFCFKLKTATIILNKNDETEAKQNDRMPKI